MPRGLYMFFPLYCLSYKYEMVLRIVFHLKMQTLILRRALAQSRRHTRFESWRHTLVKILRRMLFGSKWRARSIGCTMSFLQSFRIEISFKKLDFGKNEFVLAITCLLKFFFVRNHMTKVSLSYSDLMIESSG